jgi:HEAT repeat protein
MRRGMRWGTSLAVGGGLLVAASGCANFIDKITSREFRAKDLVHRQDPVTVLRTSTDGDARAQAMHRVKEPLKHGGGQTQQDEIVQILTESATTDLRPICRLAAISALGRFEDPRCGAVLLQAYQGAATFPTETASTIRCEAMTALGHKNSPDGLALLTQVATAAKTPAAKPDTKLVGYEADEELMKLLGGSDADSQAARDGRLAAIRALGLTKNPQAIEVLTPLAEDRDIAIRDCAREAIRHIKGEKTGPVEMMLSNAK